MLKLYQNRNLSSHMICSPMPAAAAYGHSSPPLATMWLGWFSWSVWPQCFDAVGWAAGRASGL